MRIGVLAHERDEFESISLVRAASTLGHEVVLFTLADVEFAFQAERLEARASGLDLRALDLIVSRAQIASRDDGDRYEMLTRIGVPLSDSAQAFMRSESKLATMAELAYRGVPVPETRVCRSLEELRWAVNEFGTAVVKPSHGYGGEAVERFSADEFNQELAAFMLARHPQLLVQEYLKHPEGDYRVTVAGGEVVFVARRIPNAKTWKANVSQGADIVILTDVPSAVCELGIQAASALGLFLAGVDILPNSNKYSVLEVNNCPGWSDLSPKALSRVTAQIVKKAIAEIGL